MFRMVRQFYRRRSLLVSSLLGICALNLLLYHIPGLYYLTRSYSKLYCTRYEKMHRKVSFRTKGVVSHERSGCDFSTTVLSHVSCSAPIPGPNHCSYNSPAIRQSIEKLRPQSLTKYPSFLIVSSTSMWTSGPSRWVKHDKLYNCIHKFTHSYIYSYKHPEELLYLSIYPIQTHQQHPII